MSADRVLTCDLAWHVEAADCFDFAARIPDGAVNLLWLDGPYNMGKADWDTFASVADFLAFYDRVLDVSRRILAPNGSLYVCTQPDLGDLLSVRVRERFAVLNRIRWEKGEGWHRRSARESLRSFLSPWEEIVFAEHLPTGGVHSLGRRIAEARAVCGMGRVELARRVGVDSRLIQFWEEGDRLPQEPEWTGAMGAMGGGDYATLRAEYEALRRPFNAPDGALDIWRFPTVETGTGKHPCEKPPAMLRDVIAASTRPGDVVCELFAGSGVGGEQAILQGRRYIGCDADPEWARRAVVRIRRAETEPHRSGRPISVAKQQPEQPDLFGVPA